MNHDTPSDAAALWRELSMLVVKSGVGLGGMTSSQRDLALGVAAMSLAADRTASEAEVNVLLKRALAAEARFVGTDHVELRRWLVDTGWWQRDGFGRAYQRTPAHQLRAELQPVWTALTSVDLTAWIDSRRHEEQSRREARQRAWAARGQGESHG